MTQAPVVVAAATLIVTVVVMLRVLLAQERIELAVQRIEVAAKLVAAKLEVAQDAVDGVAADLVESHARANAVVGLPGEAADEAHRAPPPTK